MTIYISVSVNTFQASLNPVLKLVLTSESFIARLNRHSSAHVQHLPGYVGTHIAGKK